MRSNETPFVNVKVENVSVFGDYIMLGGSDGFIGIGTIGKTTDLTVGEQKNVMYVIPVLNNGKAAHAADSSIKFFACSQNLVVVADNQRNLSLWTVDSARVENSESMMLTSPSKKPTGFYYNIKNEFNSMFNLSQIDPQGKYANEIILTIGFLQENDKNHLVVSTSKRIVLLGINTPEGGEAKVDSFSPLDEVDDGQYGLFALSLIEVEEKDKQANPRHGGNHLNISHSMVSHNTHSGSKEVKGKNVKIVYWKVTGSDGSTKATDTNTENICMAARSEWSIEAMNEILTNMRKL